jgi:hypothetical protein
MSKFGFASLAGGGILRLTFRAGFALIAIAIKSNLYKYLVASKFLLYNL